jgi:predicted DNA-binding transcriptional regulator YafY
VPRAWQIEVWLDTTLEEIIRQTRLSSAYFTEKRNGILFRGEVADLPWAARFLAGLGVSFVIHQPAELRTVVRDYAQKLARCAEQ